VRFFECLSFVRVTFPNIEGRSIAPEDQDSCQWHEHVVVLFLLPLIATPECSGTVHMGRSCHQVLELTQPSTCWTAASHTCCTFSHVNYPLWVHSYEWWHRCHCWWFHQWPHQWLDHAFGKDRVGRLDSLHSLKSWPLPNHTTPHLLDSLGALYKDAQSQGLCVSIPFCNGGWFHDQVKLLLHASGMPSTKEWLGESEQACLLHPIWTHTW
jgi:hypothetical protein